MSLNNLEMYPDQLADLIQKGVSAEFKPMIEQRLREMADPIISKMARDIADSIALKVHSMKSMSASDPFGKIQVQLCFNSKDVQYVSEK